MTLIRVFRVIAGILFLLIALTILQFLLPEHAPKDWIDTWPFAALTIVMMEIVAGNEKSRAAVDDLIVVYTTEPIAHHAGREILGAIVLIAEGEPRHRNVAIVRRVVDLALRGDAIALEALGEVTPAILNRAIRSDSLYDHIWGNDFRLWHGLMNKATSGDGTENARKLMCFGLGLRTAIHIPSDLSEHERLACDRMWHDFAPQGAL